MNNIQFYQNKASYYEQACREFFKDSSIPELLEEYRVQPDPDRIEVLLSVLENHLSSLSSSAEEDILHFLYDLLSHKDGDVRRRAAALAGKILSGREAALWKEFLRKMLFSNVLMPRRQRRWVGFALKVVLQSLLCCADEQKQKEFLRILTEYYKSTQWDSLTCFFLMDCATRIPYALCNDTQRKMLLGFARHFLTSSDREISCAALIFTDYWLEEGAGDGLQLEPYYELFEQISRNDPSPGVRILAKQVMHEGEEFSFVRDTDTFTQLLVENRSLEVPWIIQQVNLRILRRAAGRLHNEENSTVLLSQYASCLLNMLQFSDHIVNRLQAQDDLKQLARSLGDSVCYDAAMELVRAIETGDQAIFRYVPSCLGYLYTLLPAERRNPLRERLSALVDSRSVNVVNAVIRTSVRILQGSPEESAFFSGLLCCGLSHYHSRISLPALYLIGHDLYGSGVLPAEYKLKMHRYFDGKIPSLMPKVRDRFSLLCHYAAFDRISTFLAQYVKDQSELFQDPDAKIAFFPGAFDPFSLGNRAVVQEISRMGFHVYLCADEFSWSRQLQPLRIRQKMIAMSIADIENAFPFPEDIQVNIACPQDLAMLRQMFPGQDVYLVAGSDVIENASAYKAQPQPDSVHSLPHIVFSRNINLSRRTDEQMRQVLPPESIWLKLPSFYEHMSTAGIRENVFHGKDITDLVGKRIQNYIYEHNLYAAGAEESIRKRAPRIRPVRITSETDELTGEICLEVQTCSDPVSADNLAAVEEALDTPAGIIRGRIRYAVHDNEAEILSIEDETGYTGCAGENEKNTEASGRSGALAAMEEMLMQCKGNGIIRVCGRPGAAWKCLYEWFGFVPADKEGILYEVSLLEPVVLFSDTGYSIRDTYAKVPYVRAAIHRSQMRLLHAAAGLIKGHAVLRSEAETLSCRLMKLVCEANTSAGVSPADDTGVNGPMTCVPIGKLFRNTVIPGCVTKDLYIEQEYARDLSEIRITNAPETAPLRSQVRTIRSLMRPVMLVDDIYSLDRNGDAIHSLFTKENVPVSRFIVGLLAGTGPETEESAPVALSAVCSIPDAALVLSEAELYPFIGGTSVNSQETAHGIIPSVNPVLPYHFPELPPSVSTSAFYRFSEVCMENAIEICRALEEEYLRRNGRTLSLLRMREVFTEVRIPDSLQQDPSMENETPSELLLKEQKRLGRLRNIR